jgi:D-sedoheptulose 7-phosphate isomerase
MDYKAIIQSQLEQSIELKRYLKTEVNLLTEIAVTVTKAFVNGKKVVLLGNGGSAADAQHIAAEFTGKLYLNRKPLPAVSLSVNTSSLTAIANDFGYDQVFIRQVQSLVNDGDVVIGISTSGNSLNVILAIEEARKRGAVTIAFCGQDGKLKQYAEYALCVPSVDTPRIQEAHITAGHIICFLVEDSLFGHERKNKAVFFDRDGTITKDVPYCSRLEDLELLPDVGEGIRLLNEAGYKVILVTNQSGIGRNYFSKDTLEKIHEKMKNYLAKSGAYLDAIFYCPHRPDENCNCRKPKPGLILEAASEYNIDLQRSFMVGDKFQDIEAGHAAGCNTILISKCNEQVVEASKPVPTFTVGTFVDAMKHIIDAKEFVPEK